MKKIITVLASPLITLELALTFATPAQAQASSPFPGAGCGGNGSFRWPVKTGADADRYNVDTKPIDTSISYLHGCPRRPIPPWTAAMRKITGSTTWSCTPGSSPATHWKRSASTRTTATYI